MDPASAIITFIGTGIKVAQVIQTTLEDFRNAPEDLKILQDRVEYVRLLLSELQRRGPDILSCGDTHLLRLSRLERRAEACLEEIRNFAASMHPTVCGDSPLKINKLKWFRKRKTLSLLKNQLDALEHMLIFIANIIILSSSYIATSDGQYAPVEGYGKLLVILSHPRTDLCSTPPAKKLCPACSGLACACPTRSSSSSHCRPLPQCEPTYKAHHPSLAPYPFRRTRQLIPACFTPYIGYLTVSRRSLDALVLSSRECNAEICNSDIGPKESYQVRWNLPNSSFRLETHIRSGWADLHFILEPPRLVPLDSEIWAYIAKGDLANIRMLFGTGRTSVYDVREDGLTLLSVNVPVTSDDLYIADEGQAACFIWSTTYSEESREVIKFLVDAGASIDFKPETTRLSAQEVLFYTSIGTFLQFPGELFADRVRTSPVAIDVCQHTLRLDIMEMFEDVLTSNGVPDLGRVALGLSPQSIVDASSTRGRCSLRDLIRPRNQYTVVYTVAENEVETYQADTNETRAPIAPADVAKQGREVLAQRLPTPGLDVGGDRLLLVCHLARIQFLSALSNMQDEGGEEDFSPTMPGAYPAA